MVTYMISRLKEKISNTNKLTKILFKYGFIVSYMIFSIGMCILFNANGYDEIFVAQEVIRASLSVFCEFVISAIFFDFLNNSGH